MGTLGGQVGGLPYPPPSNYPTTGLHTSHSRELVAEVGGEEQQGWKEEGGRGMGIARQTFSKHVKLSLCVMNEEIQEGSLYMQDYGTVRPFVLLLVLNSYLRLSSTVFEV